MNSPHRYWPERLGSGLVEETHFGNRRMVCFADRPPTLTIMLENLARRFADRPAIAGDIPLTYAEFLHRVECLARGLIARGIRADDRIAFMLTNRWQALAIVFACARISAISVPIGTRQSRAELEFLLNDCGARLLIFDEEIADAVPNPDVVPSVEGMFSIMGGPHGSPPFDDLLITTGELPANASREEDAVVILYTSGTTGRPKGALLTHLGIVHSAMSFAGCLALGHEDRGLVAVPLSHVTGLVGVAIATLSAGGCVVLMRQAFKTIEFLELASSERITFSILVPTIYTLVGLSLAIGQYDLSHWRIGCFGGAPMPVATIELLSQKIPTLSLINAYGATETTSPSTIMPISDWRQNVDSVGCTVPCGRIRVVNEDGNDVAPGIFGELLISGPMVVPGYFNRPEANASDFVDGYWRSGDIGSIDANGFVRVIDRKKDMINRAGFKIYSAEVENTLSFHADILECAIVAKPDPVLGERVHAFVVARDGMTVDADSVRAFCSERLADYKVPESVTILSERLPRNSNGKIHKPTLRSMLPQDVPR